MSKLDLALDSADAVRRFAAELRSKGRAPDRIQAKLDGHDGVAGLCAVEASIAELWPPTISKELVWLTGAPKGGGDVLHLQARASDGEILGTASFRLTGR